MRSTLKLVFAAIFALSVPASSAEPVRIPDPDKFSAEIVETISKKRARDVAGMIANTIGALRQIVYYSYLEGLGFVYFRFNFKMTSTGWILANFSFKDETNELFPKDFTER
jgi:hypothetical protein